MYRQRGAPKTIEAECSTLVLHSFLQSMMAVDRCGLRFCWLFHRENTKEWLSASKLTSRSPEKGTRKEHVLEGLIHGIYEFMGKVFPRTFVFF